MKISLFLALLFLLFPLRSEPKIGEKVVIVGVCKNIGRTFSTTKLIVEEMGSLFLDYQVIIYENNSMDTTKKQLLRWQASNPKVHVTSERVDISELGKECINITEQGTYYIPEMIARARNKALKESLSDAYADFPYVIWFDLDFEVPFSLDAIVEVFTTKEPWDAVFGYGVSERGDYFDWFAFRDQEHPLGAEIYGERWWTHLEKKLYLTQDDPWYPVYSAFGGIGIYRKEALKGLSYKALVTPDLERLYEKIIRENPHHPDVLYYLQRSHESPYLLHAPLSYKDRLYADAPIQLQNFPHNLIFRMTSGVAQYPVVCEHVSLHASMILRGYDKLFINPRLKLSYSPR